MHTLELLNEYLTSGRGTPAEGLLEDELSSSSSNGGRGTCITAQEPHLLTHTQTHPVGGRERDSHIMFVCVVSIHDSHTTCVCVRACALYPVLGASSPSRCSSCSGRHQSVSQGRAFSHSSLRTDGRYSYGTAPGRLCSTALPVYTHKSYGVFTDVSRSLSRNQINSAAPPCVFE